jgi:hypothetical protein
MIGVTANAACSIALRNVAFRVVPMAVVKVLYDAARQLVLGDMDKFISQKAKAIGWFLKAGLSKEEIIHYLQRKNVEEIDRDDVLVLVGIRNSCMAGEANVSEMRAGSKASADEIIKRHNEEAESNTDMPDDRAGLIKSITELLADKGQSRADWFAELKAEKGWKKMGDVPTPYLRNKLAALLRGRETQTDDVLGKVSEFMQPEPADTDHPAPDSADALRKRIEQMIIVDGLSVAALDAACAEVAPMVGIDTMTADQLRAVLDALKGGATC